MDSWFSEGYVCKSEGNWLGWDLNLSHPFPFLYQMFLIMMNFNNIKIVNVFNKCNNLVQINTYIFKERKKRFSF